MDESNRQAADIQPQSAPLPDAPPAPASPPPSASVAVPEAAGTSTTTPPVPVDPQMYDTGTVVSWTASEYINHHKSAGWYIKLAAAAAVLAAAVFLLTGDKISTGVVVAVAVVFGWYASQQPRQLQYSLDGSALHIGSRAYPYTHFRSFAVVDEGAFSSIMFMPLKRFSPGVSLYYDPADEDRIVAALADQLPMEPRRNDLVDTLMRRIRF